MTILLKRREIVQITSERDEARNMASTAQNQLAAAESELNALRDSLTAVNCLVREAAQARQVWEFDQNDITWSGSFLKCDHYAGKSSLIYDL